MYLWTGKDSNGLIGSVAEQFTADAHPHPSQRFIYLARIMSVEAVLVITLGLDFLRTWLEWRQDSLLMDFFTRRRVRATSGACQPDIVVHFRAFSCVFVPGQRFQVLRVPIEMNRNAGAESIDSATTCRRFLTVGLHGCITSRKPMTQATDETDNAHLPTAPTTPPLPPDLTCGSTPFSKCAVDRFSVDHCY